MSNETEQREAFEVAMGETFKALLGANALATRDDGFYVFTEVALSFSTWKAALLRAQQPGHHGLTNTQMKGLEP